MLSHVHLFASLQTIARQAPLSMGFSNQEYWSGLPCPPQGNLPDSESKPESPAAVGGFFTTWTTWVEPCIQGPARKAVPWLLVLAPKLPGAPKGD